MSTPSEGHDAELVCTGIVIEVGPAGIDPRRAFDLALEVVAETLPGEWGVMPLSENFNDFHISPWSGRPIPIGRSWDLSEKLASHRDVSSAEPAFRCPGLEPTPEWLTPYEARAASLKPDGEPLPCAKDNPLWSIELTGIDRAWDAPLPPHGKGRRYGARIKVAHPDTGYTRHHEIWHESPKRRRILDRKGYDYEDDDDDATDPLEGSFPGHGTATASVIMSDHNPAPPAVWVSGAAPKSRLIPLRVSDSVIHFDFTNVAMAIHHAVDQKAHVVSMSLGGPFPSRFLERAIDRAIANGLIVCAAAGNIWPWVVYPARYEQVIAVAAVDCKKRPWPKSARGSSVDISAPGESVWRAKTEKDTNDPYVVEPGSGTSYAVATLAGAVALWLAFHGRKRLFKKYGADQLASVFREILVTHGFERPRGWDTEKYGVGLLRADRLLEADLPKTAPAAGLVPMALREPRRPPSCLERIADYFAETDRPGLRRALEQLLRAKPEDLDDLLDRHGGELIFHLATSPPLRSSIHTASRPRATMTTRRGLTKNTSLLRNSSRSLRRQMGLA